MNIVLKGEKITVPLCSCGKCIIRRKRDNLQDKYPYNKNLSSTYNTNHNEKTSGNCAVYFNRSKLTNLEVSHKEHLPSLFISTMKFDFKPFKIQAEEKKNRKKISSMPFFGNSTYSSFFPNWNCTQKKTPKDKFSFVNVPFRAYSTYGENFYKKKAPIPKFKPVNNLEFKGKIYGQPNERYNDYDKKAYFSKGENKNQTEKSKIIPADYPKNFDSTYGMDFNEKDNLCDLAKFLKNSGMKNLEL